MWAFVVAFFTKHLWSILSAVADILLIAFIVYSIWNVLHPKPTTTQNQTANKIYNYTLYPDHLDFALGKVGGFELFSFHSYPGSSVKKTSTIAVVKPLVNQVKAAINGSNTTNNH